MSSSAFPTDLWQQKSRLTGMVLAGFTYGIFFLLSIQAFMAVRRGARSTTVKLPKQTANLLYAYIIVTFILSTIGLACNARYTEDIWINFRDGPRSPEDLIINEFDFWWNRMAIDSNFVMIWIMDLLLLYRCFVIWNYNILVLTVMSVSYLAIIGLSIAVMHFAQQSAVFFNIKVQIAFLAMSCTFNLLFTILVSAKLLSMRRQILTVLGKEHASTYTSVTATLVESASLYFVFDVIFLFAFGFQSHVQNLILLEYSSIQGIAELLIIVRISRGEDYDTSVTTKPSRLDFKHTADEENTTATTTTRSRIRFHRSRGGETTTTPTGVVADDHPVVLELPHERVVTGLGTLRGSSGPDTGGSNSKGSVSEEPKEEV
ncbi:hypothetical protein L218DRAFT_909339 [Marasmius fiardii PR-910]|nr:hypothetical protein L218DRAFT_909339 [Marasmius fiardii PR-910]